MNKVTVNTIDPIELFLTEAFAVHAQQPAHMRPCSIQSALRGVTTGLQVNSCAGDLVGQVSSQKEDFT